MPPFLILTIVSVIYLPQDYRPYSFLVVITFWIVYYAWNYIEKRNLTKKLMSLNLLEDLVM